MQNTFRHLAAKKIKQISESNRYNTIHKRHQYNVNQIKKTLKQNNLSIAKADKSKALVIIGETALKQKVNKFIEENDIIKLNKDPTVTYHKQIQQAMQNCEDLIEKSKRKYLLNIKPTAPKTSAIHWSLPSCLIRFPFSNTRIPFTFPRFHCTTHRA
jgi:hypothetical protein